MGTVLLIIVGLIVLGAVVIYIIDRPHRAMVRQMMAENDARERELLATMNPEQQATYHREKDRAVRELEAKHKEAAANSPRVLEIHHGPLNPAMVCPHCQQRGRVHTKQVDRKRGISGTKATAAVLTGGASILATGLSQKDKATEAYCGNCKNTWDL